MTKELSSASAPAELKEACEFLGLSQGGSKARLCNCICQYLRSRRGQEIDHAATHLRRETDGPRVRLQSGVAQPSEEEMLLHMATHLPFKPWCDVCVKTKALLLVQPKPRQTTVESLSFRWTGCM